MHRSFKAFAGTATATAAVVLRPHRPTATATRTLASTAMGACAMLPSCRSGGVRTSGPASSVLAGFSSNSTFNSSASGRSRALLRSPTMVPARSVFMWVENIFNAPDRARLREVGQDRFAAEFVLRMSGKLRVNDSDSWVDSDSQLHGGQEMRLTDVDLSDSTVTPVGMQHFSNLKHLKRLDLSGNSYLTDDSIARLVDSPLQVLNVSNTPLTDKCVSSLTSMSALQELDVRETKLSVNARSRLQAALPKCQVHIS